MKSVLILSQSGCFLPLLIILNLFFGWMFLKPGLWLLIEAGLVILFIINALILMKNLSRMTKKGKGVVDIEGKVLH